MWPYTDRQMNFAFYIFQFYIYVKSKLSYANIVSTLFSFYIFGYKSLFVKIKF